MAGAKELYWPAIDGLRAIAVSAVVLNHLNAKLLPGGYIGVDVFFVISGFVVTGSILRSETGHVWVDLLNFWRRRWLRIMPALLAMVFGSTLLFSFFFAPVGIEPYIATLRSALFTVLGVSNLYYYRTNLDYFQIDAGINVFHHTWSLSVEEQFYLVMSLIFIVALRPLQRWLALPIARMIVVSVLLGLSISLFVVWHNGSTPMLAYFMLPARFWELCSGVLLACIHHKLGETQADKLPSAWPGYVLQLAAALLLGLAMVHPTLLGAGFFGPVVFAVIGTVALIAAIIFGGTGGVSALLASRPFVVIGLLSYPIYLWHWPIFSLVRHTVEFDGVTASMALAVVVGLAALSYRYIEQPGRRLRNETSARLALTFAVAISLALLPSLIMQVKPGGFYLGHHQAWEQTWLPRANFSYGGAAGHMRSLNCNMPDGTVVPQRVPFNCTVRAVRSNEATPQLLVLGDSNSFANWGMVIAASATTKYDVLALGHVGCQPPRISDMGTSCAAYLNALPKYLRAELRDGDIALLSFAWSSEMTEAELVSFRRFFDDFVFEAGKIGVRLIIQVPLPRFPKQPFRCIPEWFRTNYTDCDISRTEMDRIQRKPAELLTALSLQNPGMIEIWDPTERLCEGTMCRQFRDRMPLMRDRIHISYYASKMLAGDFGTMLTRLRRTP
jgi:peptidoglycan/LPS O-acetylase OafA/YrhL